MSTLLSVTSQGPLSEEAPSNLCCKRWLKISDGPTQHIAKLKTAAMLPPYLRGQILFLVSQVYLRRVDMIRQVRCPQGELRLNKVPISLSLSWEVTCVMGRSDRDLVDCMSLPDCVVLVAHDFSPWSGCSRYGQAALMCWNIADWLFLILLSPTGEKIKTHCMILYIRVVCASGKV